MNFRFNKLENTILRCNKCKRLRDVTVHPQPHICYTDISNAEIFIIGRNPGLEYDYSNVSLENMMETYKELWWKCRFGKYIRTHLGDNLVKNKIFFTNVCKCSSPKNSALLAQEKINCFPYLEEQIDIIQPRLILTFGNDARDILLKHIQNKKYKGKIKILNFYHPSYFRYTHTIYKAEYQAKFLKKIKEFFEKDETYNNI
jgi:uracil-DNA glycosylase